MAREAQPVAQLTALVETRNYIWDVTTLTLSADIPYLESKGLLEPIGFTAADVPGLIPQAVTATGWAWTSTRRRWPTVPTSSPRKVRPRGRISGMSPSFGRRSLRRSPIETLEQALLADGVPMAQLYPLDVERAFRSLDRIKKHINLWWTSGAQAMQAIQNGDVDMIATWNGRSQAAIDNGAPVKIVWNQGIYSIEGWGIPKGTPRADMARQFVRFCADGARQAAFTDTLAYGPTNTKAFELIDPKRAAILPSAPQNLQAMGLPDPAWWAANRQAVTERFNAWIVG